MRTNNGVPVKSTTHKYTSSIPFKDNGGVGGEITHNKQLGTMQDNGGVGGQVTHNKRLGTEKDFGGVGDNRGTGTDQEIGFGTR